MAGVQVLQEQIPAGTRAILEYLDSRLRGNDENRESLSLSTQALMAVAGVTVMVKTRGIMYR